MTLKPASYQTRTQTRTRRHSSCYLHPSDPAAAGICASCLRERLSGLDSPVVNLEPSSSVSHLGKDGRNKGSPEFRRCRSVSTSKCEAFGGFSAEPRRNSCDVRPRNGNSLARLFDVDDECSGSVADSKVETKNILTGAVIDAGEEDEEEDATDERIRDFNRDLQISNVIDDDEIEDEGEGKTMKEFIDLELQSKNRKPKDFKDLAGNLRGAASVFSKKLQKWRQKEKVKKLTCSNDNGIKGGKGEMNSLKGRTLEEIKSEVSEFALGRRSCDIEPSRFSIDGGRISFEEQPRASWDGYLIAKTIPRLAPMLSVVENGMLGGGNKFENHRLSVDGQMRSITEDETSSGGSGQSNSDSSSSQRRSSFDRSSSVRSFSKKIVGLEGDAKLSPTKLVITERELKDWRLKSVKEDQQLEKSSYISKVAIAVDDYKSSNLGPKKSTKWRKMWNVFGFKQKSCEKECESSSSDAVESVVTDYSEKQQRDFGEESKDANGWRLMRSNSIVGPRRSVEAIAPSHRRRSSILIDGCASKGRDQFLLDGNQNAKQVSSNFDEATLPFYLTPLRSSRRRNSICVSGNVLQLN